MYKLNTISFNDKTARRLNNLAPISGARYRSLHRRARVAVILGLGAVPLILTLLVWLPLEPKRLSDSQLSGARSPAPVSVVILLDESGSFEPHHQVRRLVIEQLVAWAPRNLRADDTITIVSFASGAAVQMPTTTVSDLAHKGFTYRTNAGVGSGTNIQPALITTWQQTRAADHATSIIVVTDTLVADLDQAQVEDLVQRLGASSMTAIVPKGVSVTDSWAQTFPWQQTLHAKAETADEVALAVGKALAHATGQHLVKSD